MDQLVSVLRSMINLWPRMLDAALIKVVWLIASRLKLRGRLNLHLIKTSKQPQCLLTRLELQKYSFTKIE